MENYSHSRIRILANAAMLFSQRGYFGVSMSDIAMKCGITKAALYYHFKSKDELLEIIIKKAVDDLKDELHRAVDNRMLNSDTLLVIVKTMLNYSKKHPELLLLTSVSLTHDNSLQPVKTVIAIRRDLLNYITELIMDLDSAGQLTVKTIRNMANTILGFIIQAMVLKERRFLLLVNQFIRLIFDEFIGNPTTAKRNTIKNNL